MLLDDLNRSSGDKPVEAPQIPPVSHKRNEEGDRLLPNRADMKHGCSSTFELPRDGNSNSLFGAMHTSHSPRDKATEDSLTNEFQIPLNHPKSLINSISSPLKRNSPRDKNSDDGLIRVH